MAAAIVDNKKLFSPCFVIDSTPLLLFSRPYNYASAYISRIN